MIVTIDGPAGAGKSSASRALARRLGFHFLDTGAMYRAVALAARQRGLDWADADALGSLAAGLDLRIDDERVLLEGADVTRQIRSLEVTLVTHYAAGNPQVRQNLVARQRQIAARGDFVTEGRDQGTVVFPQAECKIFLTASPQERAIRRWRDLLAHGEQVTVADVLAQQLERDARDAARDHGPLLRAADAVEVRTDGLSPEEVVDRLETVVRARRAELAARAAAPPVRAGRP